MLALFKAETVGAQFIPKTDSAQKRFAVEHSLPLRLVKVQKLREGVRMWVHQNDGTWIQLVRR